MKRKSLSNEAKSSHANQSTDLGRNNLELQWHINSIYKKAELALLVHNSNEQCYLKIMPLLAYFWVFRSDKITLASLEFFMHEMVLFYDDKKINQKVINELRDKFEKLLDLTLYTKRNNIQELDEKLQKLRDKHVSLYDKIHGKGYGEFRKYDREKQIRLLEKNIKCAEELCEIYTFFLVYVVKHQSEYYKNSLIDEYISVSASLQVMYGYVAINYEEKGDVEEALKFYKKMVGEGEETGDGSILGVVNKFNAKRGVDLEVFKERIKELSKKYERKINKKKDEKKQFQFNNDYSKTFFNCSHKKCYPELLKQAKKSFKSGHFLSSITSINAAIEILVNKLQSMESLDDDFPKILRVLADSYFRKAFCYKELCIRDANVEYFVMGVDACEAGIEACKLNIKDEEFVYLRDRLVLIKNELLKLQSKSDTRIDDRFYKNK